MKIFISGIKFILIASLIFLLSCSDDDNTYTNLDNTIVLEDSKPSEPIMPTGFFVANEDWLGHDDGSVNYFKNDGSIIYRAYRAANEGETLGVTTQFATIYGDNIYFVSKQEKILVVADAKTLKKKAVVTQTIVDKFPLEADGRSFLGVSPDLGYIGTVEGITLFDIKKLAIGGTIPGIEGQVGNMSLVGDRVFAVVQNKGVYVISTTDNTVEKLIEGNYSCMAQSRDGDIWIGAGSKLIKLNPYTLEISEIEITDAPISGSWGAWNAGNLCASTQKNILYWAYGGGMFGGRKHIAKYDIDTKVLDTNFYSLGKDEENVQLEFYGAGLRVEPISDKLILIIKRAGWGANGSYNWIQILSSNATLEKNIVVKGDNGSASSWSANASTEENYYWFPAIPFFEDVNSPEILLNQVILQLNERKAIYLNDKIVDADNTSASIIKSLSLKDKNSELIKYEMKADSLIITSGAVTGKTLLTIKANSNGKLVEKDIRIDVRN